MLTLAGGGTLVIGNDQDSVDGGYDPAAEAAATLYDARIFNDVRTAGEMRISNFLLWQLSYAELWFTEKCWPEFTREDFLGAIRDFASRQRRFGGLLKRSRNSNSQ